MAESWDAKGENLDLAVEGLSWLDSDSCRRGSLWSVGKEEFSKSRSRISLPSIGVLCANEPPWRYRGLGQISCLNPSKRCLMIHHQA
jgi:hypothetical protein